MKILSVINGTHSITEQFGETLPTVNDVNAILAGIKVWFDELRYTHMYTNRGPQVGATGLAAMTKYRAGNRTIKVHVDVSDEWVWTILFIMLDEDGDEIGREEKVVTNPDAEQVAGIIKPILKSFTPDQERPLTFEAVFRKKLFVSTSYLIEQKYDDAVHEALK